jgi:hypothetical protein
VLAAGTLVVAASTLVHGVTGTLGLRLYRRSAVDTVSDTGRQPVAGRQTG